MKLKIGVFIVLWVLFTTLIYAQDEPVPPGTATANTERADKKSQSFEGMEVIKMGDANVVVAKGAKVRKEGSLLVTEAVGPYSARKFAEFEERFRQMESQQSELKSQVERLTKVMEDLQKRILTTASQTTGAAGAGNQVVQ